LELEELSKSGVLFCALIVDGASLACSVSFKQLVMKKNKKPESELHWV